MLFRKNLVTLILLCGSAQLSFAQKKYTVYADVLVEAYYSGANPKYEDFYGGDIAELRHWDRGKVFKTYKYGLINPLEVLGHNLSFVSLPTGSYVIVQFTDNLVVDAPDQDDIFITEESCAKDRAEVYVSADGKNFVLLGIVGNCKTNSLDLASIAFKNIVRFVKVVGLDNHGNSPGYDLLNVKGLSGASIDTYMDLDSLEQYFREPWAIHPQKLSSKNHPRKYTVRL